VVVCYAYIPAFVMCFSTNRSSFQWNQKIERNVRHISIEMKLVTKSVRIGAPSLIDVFPFFALKLFLSSRLQYLVQKGAILRKRYVRVCIPAESAT
jgi:hypothetical protein